MPRAHLLDRLIGEDWPDLSTEAALRAFEAVPYLACGSGQVSASIAGRDSGGTAGSSGSPGDALACVPERR